MENTRKPSVVTLCGSARFERGFKYWNAALTFSGHPVFSLAVYPSDAGGKDWYTESQKETLDRVHKLKIDASDVVFVVDCEPETATRETYVGDSTRSEIAHARASGKPVFYAHDHFRCSDCMKAFHRSAALSCAWRKGDDGLMSPFLVCSGCSKVPTSTPSSGGPGGTG